MKLNDAMKRYAEKHLGVKKGSKDATYQVAFAKAIAGGKLSAAQVDQIKAGKAPSKKSKGDGDAGSLTAAIKAGFAGLGDQLRDALFPEKKGQQDAGKKKKDTRTEVEKAVDKALEEKGLVGADASPAVTLIGKAAPFLKADTARVKSVSEMYKKDRADAVYPQKSGRDGNGLAHPFAGRPATFDGRQLRHPSELDKAVCGAYLKFSIAASTDPRDIPRGLRMTDHDRDLMHYALHEMEWTGLVNGQGTEDYGVIKLEGRKLREVERKALLDDSVSGGLEAAPVVFDDMVILYPVLFGEVWPFVNTVGITRGRRIEGFSIGNPTFTSGIAEGTPITPFNTASFIQAFDTTIYTAVAAMEIGLDLEEDSPADIGGIVGERYGLKAMEWLDRVCCVGDGVTEPQGFFYAPGTTSVSSDNPGGAPTVSDYEGLLFGVSKAFRNEPGAMNCFIANDTSYRRVRSIPVGPTDERRVFGMTHQDYKLLDRPYKVQNDIPNNWIAFVNLKRYRMYRRLGMNIRVETGGNYLANRNLKLIVVRMRFGGQLELGGAASVITDAQS